MNKMYEKNHANIISKILDLEISGDKATMLNFESAGNIDNTAYIRLDLEEDIFIVCTLPVGSGKIFVTVTDGDPEIISFLLSEIARNDLTINYRMRDIVRFSNEYLELNGKIGVIILPVLVSNVLCNIGQIEYLNGCFYEMYLCTFISVEDYEYYKSFGVDALLDKFKLENKDLISIRT